MIRFTGGKNYGVAFGNSSIQINLQEKMNRYTYYSYERVAIENTYDSLVIGFVHLRYTY